MLQARRRCGREKGVENPLRGEERMKRGVELRRPLSGSLSASGLVRFQLRGSEGGSFFCLICPPGENRREGGQGKGGGSQLSTAPRMLRLTSQRLHPARMERACRALVQLQISAEGEGRRKKEEANRSREGKDVKRGLEPITNHNLLPPLTQPGPSPTPPCPYHLPKSRDTHGCWVGTR